MPFHKKCPPMNALELQWHNALAKRKTEDHLRRLAQPVMGADFCSNDYLGFSANPELQQQILAIVSRHTRCLTGATGSRLISGNSPVTEQVEDFIAGVHQVEAALLFPSGYKANLALFSCIAGRHDTILVDERVHRSVHDGCRLSPAQKRKFRHNDMLHLEEMLKKSLGHVIIAVESLYSMDGDFAPLDAITKLASSYGASVVVDEAHAMGVFGRGLVNRSGPDMLATVVTYGKAMGVQGAAVLGTDLLKSYLVNFAAPFIYSTGMPDVQALSIRAVYEHLEEQEHLPRLLQERIRYFRTQQLPGCSSEASPIQAIPFTNTSRLRSVVQALEAAHIRAYPVFAPTVPQGTERLRICLHSYNTNEEIDRLCTLIRVYD